MKIEILLVILQFTKKKADVAICLCPISVNIFIVGLQHRGAVFRGRGHRFPRQIPRLDDFFVSRGMKLKFKIS
jgi:hypothetical protein